jgi:peptidoglycan hydrolase CwlO-like protein
MPWETIITGILVWTVVAFVVTMVIKLLIDSLPSDHMDNIIEKEDAEFVSFQLKRKELESMMQNIQGAREEIKEIIEKIDEVTERGEKDE